MKNFLDWASDLIKQKTESENLKIGHLKLTSLRRKDNEEMWTEPKEFVRNHQADQFLDYSHLRNRREKEKVKKNIWRNKAENLPHLLKNMKLFSRKFNKLKNKQKDPHNYNQTVEKKDRVNLKMSREEGLIPYKGSSIILTSNFLREIIRSQKVVEKH